MRLYYGWFIVFASLVILTVVLGSTFLSITTVYAVPVKDELGLSQTSFNLAVITFTIGCAIWAPIMGKLLDRLPIRRVMTACAVIMGASLVALGFSQSPVVSLTVIGVPLALSVQGAGTLSATRLVPRWFTVYRARAMAIALFGMSLAGAVVPATIAYGMQHLTFDLPGLPAAPASGHWRQTLIVAGLLVTLILLVMQLIIREQPGPNDIESTKANPEAAVEAPVSAKPLTVLSLLLMPQFWAIGLTCGAALSLTQAVMVTYGPLGKEIATDPAQAPAIAASLISAMSLAGLAGGVITALMGDKVDRMSAIAALFVVIAIDGAIFTLGHDRQMVLAGAVVLGLATGIVSPVFHTLIADRFGAASFGTAYGLMTVLMTVLNMAWVIFAGQVFDRTHEFGQLYWAIIVVELVSAVIIFGTRMLTAPVAAPAAGASAAH